MGRLRKAQMRANGIDRDQMSARATQHWITSAQQNSGRDSKMLQRRTFLTLAGASTFTARAAMGQLPAAANAKLRRIRAATIATHDLAFVERWYGGALGYRVTERTKIGAALAKSWGAPAM